MLKDTVGEYCRVPLLGGIPKSPDVRAVDGTVRFRALSGALNCTWVEVDSLIDDDPEERGENPVATAEFQERSRESSSLQHG
jgi:hypothetical protein